MHWCMGINKRWGQPAEPVSSPVARSDLWMRAKRDRYQGVMKGYVDAHSMNTHFIQPNTDNTGHSVALNMQPANDFQPAQVLLSHAWNEDMEQVLSILEDAKSRGVRLHNGTYLKDSTPIWFW